MSKKYENYGKIKIDIVLLGNLVLMGLVSSLLPQAMILMNIPIVILTGLGLFHFKGTMQLKFLLTASIIGRREGLMAAFFLVFLWLLRKKIFVRFPQKNFIILLFFIYSFCLATIWFKGRYYIPFLVWLMTFGTGWLLYLGLTQDIKLNYGDRRELILFVRKIVFVEIFLGLLQYFFITIGVDKKIERGGVIADSFQGSFGNAHIMGYFMFGVLLYCIFSFFYDNRNYLKKILLVILVFFLVIKSDAKLDIFSLIITFPFMLILLIWFGNFNFKKRLLIISVYSFALVLFFILIYKNFIVDILNDDRIRQIKSFYIEQGFSKKVIFFNRVIKKMHREDPIVWFIGCGPGEMGSRANEMISNDVLDSSLHPSFGFSSQWTKKYMQGLLPPGLTEKIHARYSYVLTMYYSSWLAIKAELGIIGFILWVFSMFNVLLNSSILIRKTKNNKEKLVYEIFVFLFFGMFFNSIFHLSMENSNLIIPMLILNSILYSKKTS